MRNRNHHRCTMRRCAEIPEVTYLAFAGAWKRAVLTQSSPRRVQLPESRVPQSHTAVPGWALQVGVLAGCVHPGGPCPAPVFPFPACLPHPFPDAFLCSSTLSQPPEQFRLLLQQHHRRPLWVAAELDRLVSETSSVTENALLAACDTGEGVCKGFCFWKG